MVARRILALLMATLLMLSLWACGQPVTEDAPHSSNEETTQQATEVVPQQTTVPVETEPDTQPTVVLRDFYTVCEADLYAQPADDAQTNGTMETHADVSVLEIDESWATVQMDDGIFYMKAENLLEKMPSNGYVIAIDAGHQAKANLEKEPVGPGATEMKMKVSGGTSGRTTGLAEYVLTLQVALKLQKELENRGYQVVMIRTEHDVNISNSQRAMVANEADADAFIRIHANGSDDPNMSGAMTICQTKTNPYNKALYERSKALSTYVLDAMVEETGCKKMYVWETDTMSGVNWCQVPVTIVEMGFMTNPAEDTLMATDVYQYQMVQGMANGIDQFLLNP